MSRRYLIIGSIAAHAVLGAGLFISGIWKLERLDYKHRASLALGAMLPPGEAGGGEGEKQAEEKKKEKKEKKKEKTKVELRQVDKIEQDKPDETEVADATGGGGGEGDGDGPGIGPGPGPGGGGGGTCDPTVDPDQCGAAPVVHTPTCGDGVLEAPEQCDDGNRADGDRCSAACKIEQVLLPPGIFGAMRIAGDTQIVPPDTVKTQMLRDGKDRTLGSFKLCIDAGGRVASIAPINGGTKYAAYDAKITTAMRAWRYKPHTVASQGTVAAVPACSVVTFVYTIK